MQRLSLQVIHIHVFNTCCVFALHSEFSVKLAITLLVTSHHAPIVLEGPAVLASVHILCPVFLEHTARMVLSTAQSVMLDTSVPIQPVSDAMLFGTSVFDSSTRYYGYYTCGNTTSFKFRQWVERHLS